MYLRFLLFVLILSLVSNSVNCQNQFEVINPYELESVQIPLNRIAVPNHLQKFAGIRFIDVRYLKDCIGFLPSRNKNDFFKISTKNSFEAELNTFKSNNFSPSSSDSIIVLIKDFWLNKSTGSKSESYCHLSALFFIKRTDSVFYNFKVDTFLLHKIPIRDFYKDIISISIENLLSIYSGVKNNIGKVYLAKEFDENIQSKRPSAKSISDKMGIYLTYADFIKGNLYKTSFSINPFLDQFSFKIDDEKLNQRLHANIWGLVFNGDLFIRNDKLLAKAFPAGNTFVTKSNLEIDGVSFGNSAFPTRTSRFPASDTFKSNRNEDIDNIATLSSAALSVLLGRKKNKIKSFPMMLNMETGKLE
jgi:hypothetical protein